MVISHPLFKGSLCLKCKVKTHQLCECVLESETTDLEGSRVGSVEILLKLEQMSCRNITDSKEACLSRITSQKLCTGTIRTAISPTAPSAATGWRSSCVGTTAAAGGLHRLSCIYYSSPSLLDQTELVCSVSADRTATTA